MNPYKGCHPQRKTTTQPPTIHMARNKKDVIPMKCIESFVNDIYFNLATEEFLLKHSIGDFFLMWQSAPCVVVGKHQDISTEVDLDYIEKNNIKPARRFSGGGTVYQDMGNINLTFIQESEQPEFDRYPKLMSDLLSNIGIKVITNNRRSLFINGDKISGSAQYIHKNKHLYHATLLYSTDLDKLSHSVKLDKTTEEKPRNFKYIPSVKSPVTNISSHLQTQQDILQFKNSIFTSILNIPGNAEAQLNQTDIENIEKLKFAKYERKDWIFGI